MASELDILIFAGAIIFVLIIFILWLITRKITVKKHYFDNIKDFMSEIGMKQNGLINKLTDVFSGIKNSYEYTISEASRLSGIRGGDGTIPYKYCVVPKESLFFFRISKDKKDNKYFTCTNFSEDLEDTRYLFSVRDSKMFLLPWPFSSFCLQFLLPNGKPVYSNKSKEIVEQLVSENQRYIDELCEIPFITSISLGMNDVFISVKEQHKTGDDVQYLSSEHMRKAENAMLKIMKKIYELDPNSVYAGKNWFYGK